MSPAFAPTRTQTVLGALALALLIAAPIVSVCVGTSIVAQSVAQATANEVVPTHALTMGSDDTVSLARYKFAPFNAVSITETHADGALLTVGKFDADLSGDGVNLVSKGVPAGNYEVTLHDLRPSSLTAPTTFEVTVR